MNTRRDKKRQLKFSLIIDYSIYLLVRFLEEILNLLPERRALAFGRFIGRLVWVLLPDRREAALENLTIAFGREHGPEWIVRTARKSFEHVGLLAVEFFRIRRWSQKEMAERIVIEGRLPHNLAMMPGNDGICLLNSHFGCFEVSAATVKFLGIRLNVIVTGLKNPFLSRYFFSRAGKETGIKTFPHKGIVKDMIQFLHDGEMVAFLADQRGDPERGVFVDFFGTQAPANEVFAKIAIDGEARILPLCTYRREDGRYQSIFGEEIHIQLTGNQRLDLATVSQQFHDLFEQWLRIAPEQGFWLQRKWRRKPSRRRSRRSVAGRAVEAGGVLGPKKS
jgi:Kdo2-lipid IVA lauroyltransferase/acyltransferase